MFVVYFALHVNTPSSSVFLPFSDENKIHCQDTSDMNSSFSFCCFGLQKL